MNTARVSCTVGDDEYALRAAEIVAVQRADRMSVRSINEPGVGVVTVGGERVPVHSLAATLDGVAHAGDIARDRERHVVVLRGAGGLVGWLVDRVGRSHLSARTPVLPLPRALGDRPGRWFGGVLNTGDRTLLLLSLSGESDGSSASAAPFTVSHGDGAGSMKASRPLVVTFETEALPGGHASRFAVSARSVIGLESGLHVATVPGSEHPFAGVSIWRGEVRPVVDFRAAVSHRVLESQRLLIVGCQGSAWSTSVAIPVGPETTLHQPGDDDRLSDDVGADPPPPFVTGFFDVRGRRLGLVDPDRLIAAAVEARTPMFASQTPVRNLDQHVGALRG